MKLSQGFSAAVILALAALWTGPASAAQARPAGSLELHENPAHPLQVTQKLDAGLVLLQITGQGARDYDLEQSADGGIRLRFPGASLVWTAGDEGLAHAGLQADDTLTFPAATARLLRLEARSGVLELVLEEIGAVSVANYTIGIGDRVRLNIYGDAEFTDIEMRVLGDGSVSVPYIGVVEIAGKSITQATEEVTRRLAAGYMVDPKVSLEMSEYQSQWVHVSGEVDKPGRYYLKGPTRLVDIVAEAGGMRKESGTDIRITRPSRGGASDQVITVSRDDLYLSDNPAYNPILASGDTITVSAQEHFFIRGEVKSPGRYALDRNTTILKAISLAGGFDEYANQKKVELLRKQQDGETVRLLINVERIENRKAEDTAVLPGDIINVKAKFL